MIFISLFIAETKKIYVYKLDEKKKEKNSKKKTTQFLEFKSGDIKKGYTKLISVYI